LQSPDEKLSALAEEYVAETTGCLPQTVQAAGMPCSAIPQADVELRFQQDPKVRLRLIY
jgi:hypothetical protein